MRIITTTGKFQRLSGYILVMTLTLLVSACGGGDDGRASLQGGPVDRSEAFVARTGPIVGVRVGETASLSDNNSFAPSGLPLSFLWSFVSRPDGSQAVLLNPNSANPGFVADVRGTYRVQLVVSAGGDSSRPAVQLVVASIAPEDFTGLHDHRGLSSTCVICHADDVAGVTPKAGNHAAATNSCQSCHTPLGFDQVDFVDHAQVFGDCSACHNNVVAVGKSEFHMQTEAECDNCHNTISFLELAPDGSFDHTGIVRDCVGCHNGTVSRGMTPTPDDTPPGTHPVTTSDCSNCHTTDTFLNAFPDHTGPAVVGHRCDECHGANAGDQISDPPAGHPVMTRVDIAATLDCDYCHSIATFSLGGVFNHGLVDSSILACATCHNNSVNFNGLAPGKTPTPPHPNTSSDCGFCHNTTDFADAFVDHTDPVLLAQRCDSCHNGVDATGKNARPNHVVTTEDCRVCHEAGGTFATGTFDHAGIVNNCATCHDNLITVGKLPNHFPTPFGPSQDCVDCHDTTAFAGATFDHVGIDPNDCAACHNGSYTTTRNTLYGKPANHLPTTQDCSQCHTTTAPFKPAVGFVHAGIIDNCESCHNGSPAYVAAGAIGKKPNHIPALGACIVCHVDTSSGGFASSATFMSAVHQNIATGCEGCHTSQFLPLPSNPTANLVKDGNHLPTAQDCDVCHNVNAFTPTTMAAHEGITGNCVSCHDGSPGFVAFGARGKTPSPPHPDTAADCAFCHNTTNFADAFVDHSDPAVLAQRCDSCHNGVNATGKDAKPNHVVTIEDCRVCHVAGGTFAPALFDHTGIVDNCASCHDGVIATGTDAKINPPHIPITQDCSVCHTTTAFAQATFEHQGIVDNCFVCHNGTTATGKATNHVPTSGDCVNCHQTTGFLPATFDHTGIVDNCASCHGAGFATPKSVNHVPTTQDCGVCHNTNAFIPATFDHTGIVDNCVSCHDGITATGMIDAVPAHLPTSLDCHFCHTTATFVGGTWTHDASSAGNCDSCHSPGGGATSKPVGHLSTTEQCDVCHTTNRWAPTNFRHDPNGNYPGDHRRDPGCNGCHGANISSTIPWPWPQYAPFCAACHAGDFSSKSDHIGGNNGTVEQNKNCGGSGCHKVNDNGF